VLLLGLLERPLAGEPRTPHFHFFNVSPRLADLAVGGNNDLPSNARNHAITLRPPTHFFPPLPNLVSIRLPLIYEKNTKTASILGI